MSNLFYEQSGKVLQVFKIQTYENCPRSLQEKFFVNYYEGKNRFENSLVKYTFKYTD